MIAFIEGIFHVKNCYISNEKFFLNWNVFKHWVYILYYVYSAAWLYSAKIWFYCKIYRMLLYSISKCYIELRIRYRRRDRPMYIDETKEALWYHFRVLNVLFPNLSRNNEATVCCWLIDDRFVPLKVNCLSLVESLWTAIHNLCDFYNTWLSEDTMSETQAVTMDVCSCTFHCDKMH